MAERETFGEKKVQRNFNPSANPKRRTKAKYADLIDDLALKDVGETQDVCLSLKLN
jgi:hypothetical protein